MLKKQEKRGVIREYAEAIITALLIALVIRAFVVQAFKIPSGSMIPTLLVGDHLLVNKFIYGVKLPFTDIRILAFKNPERGEIVVFKYPRDHSRDFIKRVIAKEGDIVEIKDKVVYVNSVPLKEPYIQHLDSKIRHKLDSRDNIEPTTIPKGMLFVMGDNRDQSFDSRYWGFVDLKLIKGEALIIYWSWDKYTKLPRFRRIGRLIE